MAIYATPLYLVYYFIRYGKLQYITMVTVYHNASKDMRSIFVFDMLLQWIRVWLNFCFLSLNQPAIFCMGTGPCYHTKLWWEASISLCLHAISDDLVEQVSGQFYEPCSSHILTGYVCVQAPLQWRVW